MYSWDRREEEAILAGFKAVVKNRYGDRLYNLRCKSWEIANEKEERVDRSDKGGYFHNMAEFKPDNIGRTTWRALCEVKDCVLYIILFSFLLINI